MSCSRRHCRHHGFQQHAVRALLGLFLGASLQSDGEFLYEGFESLDVGQSVGQLQGWGTLGGSDVDCVASSNHVFQGCRALSTTDQGTLVEKWSSAAFTNFSCVYRATNHPIIRMSVMLYRTNNSQVVRLGLGHGTNLQVWAGSSTAKSAIVVNNYTTGVNFVTGRFVNLTLLYNMAENRTALEYDGVNIMPWRSVGSSVSTQFNLFAVRRHIPAFDLSIAGEVTLDAVTVETFPAATEAWFRFEDDAHDQITEHTGSFRPAPLYFTGFFAPCAWSQLKIENDVVHNRNAYRNAISADISRNALTNFFLNNWTLEFLASIDDSETTAISRLLFEITTSEPAMTATNAQISIIWATNQFLYASLRKDRCDLPGGLHNIPQAVPLPADHRWHHIAFVRSGQYLETYLDYELYRYVELTLPISDGSYHLTTNHYAVLGDVDYTHNSSMDEIRLTGRALAPDEFLSINGAAFMGNLRLEGTNFHACVEQRDHTGHRIEINTNNLAGNSWATWHTYTATGTTQDISFGLPTVPHSAIRLR